MRVCFFGSYKRSEYNMLVKKMLEYQKVEVIECHKDIKNFRSFLTAYVKLFFKHRNLDYDILISPWRGIMTLPLAKLISRKPIVHFAFLSIYDTLVEDRKLIKPNSIKSKICEIVDKIGCKISNIIILDSFAEINYFVDRYNLDRSKFHRLFLSADESKFKPLEINKSNQVFNVLFFGSFSPHHGVEIIIEAAKILKNQKDIFFNFCGDGQTKNNMEKLAKKYNLTNNKFWGFVSQEKFQELIKESDVCLGIFGESIKADKGITNKLYETLASQRPLITLSNKAIKEINLVNKKNCVLVNRNPLELANAIKFLKNNPNQLEDIAKNGFLTFKENFSMDIVSNELIKILRNLIEKPNEKK